MAITLTDIVTYKRLIAAANNEVWYEVSAGEMTELTDANGDIDTTDMLTMFEAYGKVFVVNGTNLKVADFINTKLTSDAEITTELPVHGDILTQDQTGSKYAHMVVDFVSAWAGGEHLVYGYAYYEGGATAFTTDHNVKDADGNTVIASGNLTTVTAKPHWYDWTVYNGDASTYGTMPNKAYLGCNYRGRPMLSGDPEHPYQWYMPRQDNPWDWMYIANDAQSPVKGGNSDMGELGDIIRALIPYKDDYLIMGCASSVWFMAGDPMDGGSLNELDLTVGMYGAQSWCFDGKGNLYFWGTNGIYKTAIPGTPECISEIRLPGLVKDESVNPSAYRITMAYDRARVGILICITKLSDGSNSNYWYDLRADGFFPESYGNNRGAYSLFHYAANSATYRDLLVGCADGYIRKFNASLKSDNDSADNAGVGTVLIDSYVTFGPMQLARDPKFKGKITGLDLISAGGGVDGSQSDSDDVDCEVYVAKSAEEVKEKLSAGTNPNFSKTLKAPGRSRGNIVRRKIAGVYAGIKLQNDTAGETWGFEQLLIDVKKSGKFK